MMNKHIQYSEAFKKYFLENGNTPTRQYDILDETFILGRFHRPGDHAETAYINPSLKGYFNWITHVRDGIKATIVKVSRNMVQYKEGLEILDDLVYKFYEEEVNVEEIHSYNSPEYADKCLSYVAKKLIDLGRSKLIGFLPIDKEELEELEIKLEDLEKEKEKIENERKIIEDEINQITGLPRSGTWYCMVSEYFRAEQVDMGIVWEGNSVEERQRKHNSDASCGDYYILDTIWCKDVRKLEDIIKASYPFWRCSNANTRRDKEVWNFKTRDLDIINNIILPHAKLLADKINNS